MSYSTIAASVVDAALVERITACAMQEATHNVDHAATELGAQLRINPGAAAVFVYPVCSASDVEAAYASALAGDNDDPGGDPTVVTDPMILANVAAVFDATP